MINFKIGDKEYGMINSYNEMTFAQLIELKNIVPPTGPDDILSYSKYIRLFSNVDSDDVFEDMDMPIFNQLVDALVFLSEEMKYDDEPTVNINGNTYVISKNIDDMSKLTMGEVISINVLRDASRAAGYNTYDYLPKMLAILIRPGYSVENKEFGTKEWKQDKFRSEDIDKRAELLLKHLSAPQAMKVANFFLRSKN